MLDNGQLGVVVPPNDTQALVRDIVQALTDPAVQQTAIKTRTVVCERYAIQHSVDRTATLYRRLLSR
ncbi:MAG: hypothetical protein ABI947_27330 [Chloroflexota bacterium]